MDFSILFNDLLINSKIVSAVINALVTTNFKNHLKFKKKKNHNFLKKFMAFSILLTCEQLKNVKNPKKKKKKKSSIFKKISGGLYLI